MWYAWSWLLFAFITYNVCFHVHSDAGEDEGDLDFSALLKATKKWDELHLFLQIKKITLNSSAFPLPCDLDPVLISLWLAGTRSLRRKNPTLMCGNCSRMPIQASTRKSPFSMASPTWGACWNVWKRWRSSPSTARVRGFEHEVKGSCYERHKLQKKCEFHCRREMEGGNKQSFLWGNVFLCLSSLPAIAAFLKRLESCYSVEKGKKIVLRCEVVNPNIQVKWLKNGQEIKPSAKYVIK